VAARGGAEPVAVTRAAVAAKLRVLLPGVLCAALAWAASARAQEREAAQGFVRVQGTSFTLDGAAFRFLGANVSVMHGPREREHYEAVLDAVAADGLKVVRLWALGEQPAPGESYHPLYAFRIGERGWVEASFEHLDRVLVAARARGLKVIIVLANRWKDYGGIATYLRWGGAAVQRDALGEPVSGALTAFFDCAACQLLYREHVARVVGRVNSITGAAYRADPTIFAWELINEASAVSAHDEDALIGWVKSTVSLVRSLDANHLISAGHIGYQTSRERRVWRAVQSLPEVDFADAHLYPQTDRRVASAGQLKALLDDPIALAALSLHKPLVFGEFGFERTARSFAARSRWTDTFLGHFVQRAAAGALIWLYEPPGNPQRTHSISASAADADSRELRRTLRSAAERLARVGPGTMPPDWMRPDAVLPEFSSNKAERVSRAAHRGFALRGDEQVLEIDPVEFASAQFERLGVYDNHALETVWGAGEGHVEYRFLAPPGVPGSVRVEARISSELPGIGDGKDPRDSSDIEITLDGELVGTVRAPADDGFGEVVEVELRDARALKRLFRSGRTHSLRLRALPAKYAGGLCIYGAVTGRAPMPEGRARDVSSVRISLTPLRAKRP
jgi:mannan endo-1,4-beta-mannosidase